MSEAPLRDRLTPFGPRPDPTQADGPDPYGNDDPEWLRIDWSRYLSTVTVPGARINFAEMKPPPGEQAERAIVFVHGLSGCWQNFLEQIPRFADTHRALAPDLPGFGCSPMPHGKISIPRYGELLRAFCDALEVRDAVLVGNSMGGFISAEAVITEPERFEKLVLISAAGVSSTRLRRAPTSVAARMISAAAPAAFRLQERSFRRPRARAAAFRNVFRHPELLRAELLWECFEGSRRGSAFAEALGALAGYDFRERLRAVEVPSLIVWGRDDMVVPPADALEFGRLLSNSETVIFDDCGHVPQVERPARFNRLLGAFLSDPEGGPDGANR